MKTDIINISSHSNKDVMGQVIKLSIPAILSEISSVAMQYIDAAMVGSLGANASASIGLVSTTTWLFGGIAGALAVGFSVQVAHAIGAGKELRARQVRKQGYITCFLFGLFACLIGLMISGRLPVWLGGREEILHDAVLYFRVFSVCLLFAMIRRLSGGMLQCSGNMRTPSILNISLCVFDVLFNWIFIFPQREIMFGNLYITIPGFGLGVLGAALGTMLAEAVVCIMMLVAVLYHSPVLRLRRGEKLPLDGAIMNNALKIAIPIMAENTALNGAQIVSTRIVAPLGTVSIAANSLAVTAESLCYMPGYGISQAATTLVGQSLGGGRKDLAKRYARLSVLLGMLVMGVAAVFMYLFADVIFASLTNDPYVRELGVKILRIEAFAEPLYAASICTAGALRGAGDTLIPSILNLISMWGVRITLALVLAPMMGLTGVWIAMALELSVRGILYLIRLYRGKWLNRVVIQ